MTERVFQGPFLTRAQAGRRAGVPARLLTHRPDLLSIRSYWLQEAYFAFQFDDDGVRPDLGTVVQRLKGRYPDIAIGDWLVRPNLALRGSTPLQCFDAGAAHALDRVLAAARSDGPIAEDLWSAFLPSPLRETPAKGGIDVPEAPQADRVGGRSRTPRKGRQPGSRPATAAR